MSISIIICCYNSAKRLPQTLLHIAKQKIPETIACELIVVDNNCTDDTVAVTNSFWKKLESNIPLRIVEEKTPGLSSARHKGVASANYENIIFCDDDNWLDENYVFIAHKLMSSSPTIGAIGGQSELVADEYTKIPNWFQEIATSYAIGKQATNSGIVTNKKYLWGAGLVFRKSLYLKAFNKIPSLLSDRKGSELSSGGDSEICARFILMGFDLYYEDELRFKHFIEESRFSDNYKTNLIKGHNEAMAILAKYWNYIDYANQTIKTRLFRITKFFVITFLFVGSKVRNRTTSVELLMLNTHFFFFKVGKEYQKIHLMYKHFECDRNVS